jgi:hypothetical protein
VCACVGGLCAGHTGACGSGGWLCVGVVVVGHTGQHQVTSFLSEDLASLLKRALGCMQIMGLHALGKLGGDRGGRDYVIA